jgi:glutamate synthase (NADPH/NADH) large chain
VQVDGGLRTGRDVVVGALLGADEFGFATAPLIAAGCIMMRKCHLNTCPVGIATQDPELRKRFTGKPEHVINYFFFIAEEVREMMAAMGFRTIDEMIGRTDFLDKESAIDHWKAKGLDFSKIFSMPKVSKDVPIHHNCERQDHLGSTRPRPQADREGRRPALENKASRSAWTSRSATWTGHRSPCCPAKWHALRPRRPARRHHLTSRLRGTAGQSFGAFVAKGVTLDLIGEGNDYVGKGLSGGR